MSNNLYFRRMPKNPPRERTLSDQLRYSISQRYWQHDGTLRGLPVNLTQCDVEYLRGLRDGGIKDAGILLQEIEAGHDVEVWIDE